MDKDKKYNIWLVADILGVPKAKAYNLIYKNKLGCVRFRGGVYVTDSHLRKYADNLVIEAILYKEKVFKNIAEIRNKNGHRLGYYTIQECAKILDISEATVFRKMKMGELLPEKQGRSTVFLYGFFYEYCYRIIESAQGQCDNILDKLNKCEEIHG